MANRNNKRNKLYNLLRRLQSSLISLKRQKKSWFRILKPRQTGRNNQKKSFVRLNKKSCRYSKRTKSIKSQMSKSKSVSSSAKEQRTTSKSQRITSKTLLQSSKKMSVKFQCSPSTSLNPQRNSVCLCQTMLHLSLINYKQVNPTLQNKVLKSLKMPRFKGQNVHLESNQLCVLAENCLKTSYSRFLYKQLNQSSLIQCCSYLNESQLQNKQGKDVFAKALTTKNKQLMK